VPAQATWHPVSILFLASPCCFKMQTLQRTSGAQTRVARRSHPQHACVAVQAVRLTTNPRQHSTTADLVSFQPAGRVLAQLAANNSCLRAPVVCRAAPDANVAVQESLQGKSAHTLYCILPSPLCCACTSALQATPNNLVVLYFLCRLYMQGSPTCFSMHNPTAGATGPAYVAETRAAAGAAAGL
jgi:hypothetical protein